MAEMHNTANHEKPAVSPIAKTARHVVTNLVVQEAIKRRQAGQEDIYAPEVAELIFGAKTEATVAQVREVLRDAFFDLRNNYGFSPIFLRTDLWFYGSDASGKPFRTTPPQEIKGFEALRGKWTPRGYDVAAGLYFPRDGIENLLVKIADSRATTSLGARVEKVRAALVDHTERGFLPASEVPAIWGQAKLVNGITSAQHKLLGEGDE